MNRSIKTLLSDYREVSLVILIFVIALVLRLWLFFISDDFHGVSAGKVLQAELILKNGISDGSWYIPIHPPFHLLILILGLKLYNNPLVVPRLISLIFGSSLIFPFYYYVKEVFSPKVAIFSILGIIFYSEHIVYSVIATSETSFHFLLFLGLFLFILFIKQNQKNMLFFSGLSISFASMCRYEGLIFIPLILFFLLIKNKKKEAALFLLVSLTLPAIWAGINNKYSGDLLQFLNTNDFNVPLQFNWIRSKGIIIDLKHKLLFWPIVLRETLGFPIFLAGLLGIFYCLSKKEKIFPTYVFLILFAIFIIRTIQERLYLQPRYSITLGLMLIPFAFFSFFKFISLFKKQYLNLFAFILIWSMIPPVGQRILEEPLSIPYFAKDIAGYLRKYVDKNDNIIMDHCGDEKYREPIKLFSGINPSQFILEPYTVLRGGWWVVDQKKFFAVLNKFDMKFLVYSPYGDLAEILALEKKGNFSKINGFIFEKKYESGPYLIYRIRKGSKNG